MFNGFFIKSLLTFLPAIVFVKASTLMSLYGIYVVSVRFSLSGGYFFFFSLAIDYHYINILYCSKFMIVPRF